MLNSYNYVYNNQESNMLAEIKTTKDKLLAKLNENLTNHIKIYEEAKVGYAKNAKKLLKGKLKEIEVSTAPVRLSFDLKVPENHEKEYRQAISMVEWSDNPEITLTAEQFRKFVLDDWDWSRLFFASNAVYSSTAASGCISRGY